MFIEAFSQRHNLSPATQCATILKDCPIVSNPEPLAWNALRKDLILGRLYVPDSTGIPWERIVPGLTSLSPLVHSLWGGVAHTAVSQAICLIPVVKTQAFPFGQNIPFTNWCASELLKNNINIYIKTALTCFGVVTPSLGSALFVLAKVTVVKTKLKSKINSVALVRERTIPTERPPPVGEVSANFCG